MGSRSTNRLFKRAGFDGASGWLKGMQFTSGEIDPEQTLMDRIPDRAFPMFSTKIHRKPCES